MLTVGWMTRIAEVFGCRRADLIEDNASGGIREGDNSDAIRTWLRQGLMQPGKSQSGLAKALGRSEASVSRMLSGTRRVQLKHLPIFVAYLGRDLPPDVLSSSSARLHPTVDAAVHGQEEGRNVGAPSARILVRDDGTSEPYIDWINRGLRTPGKNKKGLAGALGVHPSQVSQLLNGRRRLLASELAKVSEYLETPVPSERGNSGGRGNAREEEISALEINKALAAFGKLTFDELRSTSDDKLSEFHDFCRDWLDRAAAEQTRRKR
jgi:plasmid maintenance system antidote protein VapI